MNKIINPIYPFWQRLQLAKRLNVHYGVLIQWAEKQPPKWWEKYPFSPLELIATQQIQGGSIDFLLKTLPRSELSRVNEKGLTPIQVGFLKLSQQKNSDDFVRQMAFVHELLSLEPVCTPQDASYFCRAIIRNLKNEDSLGRLSQSYYQKRYQRLFLWAHVFMEKQDFPLVYEGLREYWISPFSPLRHYKPVSVKPFLKPAQDGLWLLEQLNHILYTNPRILENAPSWIHTLPSKMEAQFNNFSAYEIDKTREDLKKEVQNTSLLLNKAHLELAIPEINPDEIKSCPQKRL